MSSSTRVVASGIDTLELWTSHPVAHEACAWLEQQRSAARDAWEPIPLPPEALQALPDSWAQALAEEGVTLQLEPHGARGARYLLTSDLYALRVQPRTGEGSPTVTVEVRAMALWASGWPVAAERAVRLLRALCGGERVEVAHLDVQCGRVDLCVDVQPVGWAPHPAMAEQFVGRIRKASRGRHWAVSPEEWWRDERELRSEVGRVVSTAQRLAAARSDSERRSLLAEIHGDDGGALLTVYGDALTFTGFSWGRGSIAARLYDKTRELSVSRKGWFRGVWRRSGVYDEERPVWRLEFQLRREGLRQIREDSSEAGRDVSPGAWRDVRAQLSELWRYLTHRWLRASSGRQADTRQAVEWWWAELQQAWRDEPAAAAPEAVWRSTLVDGGAVVVPALAGYLSSGVAQVQTERAAQGLEPLPYSRALLAAVRAAHAYREAKGETCQARAAARGKAIVQRRQALTGSRAARLALAGACRAPTAAARKAAWNAERFALWTVADERGRGSALPFVRTLDE